jgi:hypothetical protein
MPPQPYLLEHELAYIATTTGVGTGAWALGALLVDRPEKMGRASLFGAAFGFAWGLLHITSIALLT